MELVVLARSLSLSAQRTVDAWRASGVEVRTSLDAKPASGIAIFGLDPSLEHALARSLVHQETPVVVFFEGDEGLVSSSYLDSAFYDDVAPTPPSAAWDAALGRLLIDHRVHFVFRTEWHRQTLARRLGFENFPRSHVIPCAAPASVQRSPAKLRVLFPGLVTPTRRHGADTFVRAGVELLHRVKDLELVVITERIRDERVLAPLAGRALLRLSENEAFATSTLALVTARDGDRLGGVVECTARGVLPFAVSHQALPDSVVQLTEDPGAIADSVLKERKHVLPSISFGDPKAELATFRTEPRARVTVTAPVLTIGVPAWNAQKFLSRCIGSLLRARNSEKLEVIVVDDGSTDETAAVASRLNVRVVRQPNKGHGGAINTALREARGTFFRVVDADDFVDSVALEKLITALEHETADLVLTGYAEDRPNEPLPLPVQTLRRLPAGALTRFDTILDPIYGLTSWGPILSTSTFRTELLRRCGLTLTENSAYVDLEYCTLGLELVETMRHLPLDLYRYSLGVDGQTVTPESYRKRFRQHEAVIIRLCEFVKHNPRLSEAKRQYIAQRVLAPVITTHLDVVLVLVGEAAEAKAFRKRMEAYPFVHLPPNRALRRLAARAARAALPPTLVDALSGAPERSPGELARTLGRYVLPGALSRRNSD